MSIGRGPGMSWRQRPGFQMASQPYLNLHCRICFRAGISRQQLEKLLTYPHAFLELSSPVECVVPFHLVFLGEPHFYT